jgi:RNA polymerase sigma-70 factor, ECF subfamily
MSTVVIRFGSSSPGSLHDSSLNAPASDAPIIAKSGEDASELRHNAACELDLLSAAKRGDQHAFVELCRRHSPYLKRRIRRIVRNFEDAEDVFQETLMSAFRHVAGFRAQCTFRTWMMKIATNTSLMLLRKQRNRHETGFGLVTTEGKEFEILQATDPLPNPEQAYAKRQASHRISEAISGLPAGFRVLVEHFHQDEIKLADAANSIGITVAAAKSRLFRARIALRRHLTNDDKRVS